MRITAIRPTTVAVPLHTEEHWAYGARRGVISVLIEVDTDEGVTGIGEAPAYPSADVVLAALRTIEPLVLGQDPRRTERIATVIDVVGTWHHVKSTSPAMAGVDMACWDILGKISGQPLVTLFGGALDDDPAPEYIYYVPHDTPEAMAEHAQRGVAEGFHSFYLKVGSERVSGDVEMVRAVRDAIGERRALRVDANEAWSTGAALTRLRHLEPFGIEFAEQPVSGRNLSEMAALRTRTGIPLLANEASWTRYDQLDVIRAGAADAISVDNQMDGGLMNMKRSAGMCAVAGIPVVKHSLGELGVATYASAHVLASTPGFTYANQSYSALLSDDVLVGGPPRYRDGCLPVPDSPGIGVELDHDRVARYAELYRSRGKEFAFDDPEARTRTPQLPKA